MSRARREKRKRTNWWKIRKRDIRQELDRQAISGPVRRQILASFDAMADAAENPMPFIPQYIPVPYEEWRFRVGQGWRPRGVYREDHGLEALAGDS